MVVSSGALHISGGGATEVGDCAGETQLQSKMLLKGLRKLLLHPFSVLQK